jgi:hypothetical protein
VLRLQGRTGTIMLMNPANRVRILQPYCGCRDAKFELYNTLRVLVVLIVSQTFSRKSYKTRETYKTALVYRYKQ